MAGKELEPTGTEGEDYHIIRKSGKEILVPIRKSPDEPYSDVPQVRAYQLVHEGRIGGHRNGNGDGGRKKRISKAVVEEAQERLQPKIIRVLERGLNRSAGIKHNLATVKLITDMEHHEASLELKEEELDLSKADRGELIGTLRALLEDPQTEVALEDIWEGSAEELEETVNTEDTTDTSENGTVPVPSGSGSTTVTGIGERAEGEAAQGTGSPNGDSGEAQTNGADAGQAAGHGRGTPAPDRSARINPWKEAIERGSDE